MNDRRSNGTPSVPCGTLRDEASDVRAQREDPASLHFMTRSERSAFSAVDDYLRRNPRTTELRACRTLDIDFEFYLAAKIKAVAGPSEWAHCSTADLIRPGNPILGGAKGPRTVRSTRPPTSPTEKAIIDERDREAIEGVQAYQRAHQAATVRDACRAIGIEYRVYDSALKRRWRLKQQAQLKEGA